MNDFMLNLNDYDLVSIHIDVTEEDHKDGLIKSREYSWYDFDGDTIAHVSVEWWPDNWVSCYDLEVNEKYRHRGLGGQIVDFLTGIIGVNHLSVDPDNKIAIKMYQDHGFKFTGTKDGDLLRMEYDENGKA